MISILNAVEKNEWRIVNLFLTKGLEVNKKPLKLVIFLFLKIIFYKIIILL
jgi:hypothetical protein